MVATTLPKYFIFQRCRYYGFWPELEFRGTAPFKMACFANSELANADFQIWYRAYENIPNLNEAPTEISGDVIEFIDFGQGGGFCIGDIRYTEGKPGDVVGQAKLIKPKQGEVDLYISCNLESGQEINIDKLYSLVVPIMPALVLYFSNLVGDVVVPVGRPEGMQRSGTNSTLASNNASSMTLLPRPRIQNNALHYALNGCAHFSENLSRAEALEIGTAAKRIMSGRQEFDPVDKYCDYWEACEFLCKAPKFKPDHRLAKILENATDINQNLLKAKIVGPLYDLRKDIVHNAIEDMNRIKRAIPIIEDIASLVFGYRCGLRRAHLAGPLADYYKTLRDNRAIPI